MSETALVSTAQELQDEYLLYLNNYGQGNYDPFKKPFRYKSNAGMTFSLIGNQPIKGVRDDAPKELNVVTIISQATGIFVTGSELYKEAGNAIVASGSAVVDSGFDLTVLGGAMVASDSTITLAGSAMVDSGIDTAVSAIPMVDSGIDTAVSANALTFTGSDIAINARIDQFSVIDSEDKKAEATTNSEEKSEIENEITKLLSWGAEIEFEQGMENDFTRTLESMVLKYENLAIEMLSDAINQRKINEDLISEMAQYLGIITDEKTNIKRRLFLIQLLKHNSNYVRYGAVIGLENLNDPEAIPDIKAAAKKEDFQPLEIEMKEIAKILRSS